VHTVLEKMIEQADGSYLGSKDVQVILDYAQSVQLRIEAYQAIKEQEPQIVALALEKVYVHADYMNRYINNEGGKCLRDMTTTLRYCSTSMLLNDQQFLQEEYLIWLETIIRSLKHKHLTLISLESLGNALADMLPQEQYKLMAPFLNLVCDAFRE
jgi:Phycobilisome protein